MGRDGIDRLNENPDSVALIADAIHTLADSVTSVVIIIGFKIAKKPSDKEHPFGHGRTESVVTLIVSVRVDSSRFSMNCFRAWLKEWGRRLNRIPTRPSMETSRNHRRHRKSRANRVDGRYPLNHRETIWPIPAGRFHSGYRRVC